MVFKSYTHIGNRDVNEDSLGCIQKQDKYCFIVADGLGGHGQGEIASQMVVDVAMKTFLDNAHLDICEIVKICFDTAQMVLMNKIEETNSYSQMKTTLVILVSDGNEAIYGHVGDSRCYHYRNAKLQSVSLDHSVPQMLVMSKRIKRADIAHHCDRNRLLKVLGIEWSEPKYEISNRIALKKADKFLLCTDGFWENMEEKLIPNFLKNNEDVEDALNKMKEHVLSNGLSQDMDNNTAILVRYGE